MPPRQVSDLDVEIGARVRARRVEVGLSQVALGDRLGMTFQQVQKYERGSNRIAAATLFEIAKVLDLPVAAFFPSSAIVGEQIDSVAIRQLDSELARDLIQTLGRIRSAHDAETLVAVARLLAERSQMKTENAPT